MVSDRGAQILKELDQLDKKILQELCENGRQSNQDLAAKVGLSASPFAGFKRRIF